MLPIAKSKGKLQDEFINLERKLASELMRQWHETYTEALKEIFKSIPSFTSKDAVKLLQDLLLDALGSAFGGSKTVRNLVDKHITDAYSSAKSKWLLKKLKNSPNSPLLSLLDKKAIAVLTRHNCFWIGQHYGNHVGPKIAKIAQRALDEGMGRDALAEELRQELGGVAPEGYAYWDVVASSAIVRARSFGSISGMEEAGITEYEILAMGDERMCDICGTLNGTVFSVAETRKVIDKALYITDPEEFKAALPWFKEPPAGKSAAELTRNGQSLPPFHGRCRCTLVMVESTTEMEPEMPQWEPWRTLQPGAAERNPDVTKDSQHLVMPTFTNERIRGIIKEDIDKSRGSRGHMNSGELTIEIIREDYKRVGVEITEKEAKRIHDSVNAFTGSHYRDMRKAFNKYRDGGLLNSHETKMLNMFMDANEYARVGPTYQGSGKELYRGISRGGDYAEKLLTLTPGDTFDLEMPSSFSSTLMRSESFAGYNGIVLHVSDNDVMDAVSIKGLSQFSSEDEILVDDRRWRVVKVEDRDDGRHHITMKRVKTNDKKTD